MESEGSSGEVQRREAYCREVMAGLELPTPCPIMREEAEQRLGYDRVQHWLSPEESRAFFDFARVRQLTPPMLVQAAWAVLMARYADEERVLFAVAVRRAEAGAGGWGFAPKRAHVERTQPLGSWLSAVQQEEMESEAHAFASLEALQAACRTASGERAFWCLVAFSEEQGAERIADEDIPLTVSVALRDGRLSVEVIYARSSFDARSLQRLIQHYRHVLEGIVLGAGERVGDLSLLTKSELEQLLYTWNQTATAYPPLGVHELFEQRASEMPGAIALVSQAEQVSYEALNVRANRLAHHLISLGVGPGDLVGVSMERSVEMIVAILAILKAGGAYVALDPSLPADRWSFMLADTRASLIVIQSKFAEALPTSNVRVVEIEGGWQKADDLDSTDPHVHVTPEQLAYVSFTSGSTGRPKGVSVPHRGVVRLVTHTNYCTLDASQVFLQFAPLAFDASTFEIWGALCNGARLVVMPPDEGTLVELGAQLQRHGVTTLWLTAGLFQLMVDEHLAALRSVRQLLTGGDVVSPVHVRKVLAALPGCQVINGYGPTENTTFTCCFRVTTSEELGATVPIGRPISNTQVYILDKQREPVPVGVPGELYAGGDGLALGYWERPELTRERFVEHPFDPRPDARLYRTGDYAKYLPDGTIEFLGRRDHQVKIRGFRIELGEIEAALMTHDAVREAVVVARSHHERKQLVAYLVLEPGAELESDAIASFVSSRLPAYMVPVAWVTLPELPLGPTGKVDRRLLPAPDLTGGGSHVAPRTPSERLLASLWSEVLGLESVGLHESFFALGGDSLAATQLSHRVSRAFRIRAPLSLTFEAPTVAEMASRIDAFEADPAPSEAPSIGGDIACRYEPFPLTDIQQAYFLGRLGRFELGNVACHLYLEFSTEIEDLDRLASAWQQLVARHDMLRAVVDQNGMQRVLETVPRYEFEDFDLTHLGQEDGEAALEELRAKQSHEVFATDTWPLFKISVVRLGHERRLHLSFDLLIVDGFSFLVLFEEWRRYYEDPSWAPSALSVGFRDYALYASRSEGQSDYESARSYWRSRLDTLPPGPQLPLATSPARIDKPSFERVHSRIDEATWKVLKERASARGLTPSALLCTAYSGVLAAWSKTQRFSLNLTLFNRPPIHPEVERLVGDFTTLTLLETSWAPGASFQERATSLQRQLWQDLEHRAYGGVRVLRDMARRHRWGTSARIPVVFTSLLRDFSKWNWLGRLDYSITQTPQVWLDHVAMENKGDLVFHWDAVARLFPAHLVEDMFEAYCAWLELLAEDEKAWVNPMESVLPESLTSTPARVRSVALDGASLQHSTPQTVRNDCHATQQQRFVDEQRRRVEALSDAQLLELFDSFAR